LVELQDTIPQLEQAGLAAYAISYDSVTILANFAAEKEITYPLLSDAGSVVISRLGMLNPYVRKQHGETNELHEDRFEGVPYPGAFLLDESGLVVDRRLHADYRIRESASALVDGRFGFVAAFLEGDSYVDDVVKVTVRPESDRFSPYQMVWFEIQVAVKAGWHIYANPAPSGLTALNVGIDVETYLQPGELVVDQDPLVLELAGSDQPVPALEGDVRLRLPVVVATSGREPADVTGFVEYQACSETECLPPRRVEWSVHLLPREV